MGSAPATAPSEHGGSLIRRRQASRTATHSTGSRSAMYKGGQNMQRVQTLGPVRSWLPAVVGMIGVAYGVISLRGMRQPNTREMALAAPGRLRVFPAVALNIGGLALILIGSRLHGHWFIRVVRHSPAQSLMIAGELSCQPFWTSAHEEEESNAISETLSATVY